MSLYQSSSCKLSIHHPTIIHLQFGFKSCLQFQRKSFYIFQQCHMLDYVLEWWPPWISDIGNQSYTWDNSHKIKFQTTEEIQKNSASSLSQSKCIGSGSHVVLAPRAQYLIKHTKKTQSCKIYIWLISFRENVKVDTKY